MSEIIPLPLEGLSVVEFAQLVAGPSAGLLLADYGAQVIKVEPPEGDAGRRLRSAAAAGLDDAPVFSAYNRNKTSVRLDLKTDEGRDRALELIAAADILIESARPGAMDRLGFGSEALLQKFPRLIYASISGFGETPGARDRGGVDMIVQAESGIMSTTGLPDMPMKVGFTVVDAAAGHALCHGILAALLRRGQTGAGGVVRTSLYEVALHLQAGPLVEYLVTGKQGVRAGNSAPLTAPADLLRCRNGELVVSAYQDHHWRAFCGAIGGECLIGDPRFTDASVRVANRDALKVEIEALLQARDTSEWLAILKAIGLLVGEVRDYAAVVGDTVTIETGMLAQTSGGFAVLSPIELKGTGRRPPFDLVEGNAGDA